MVSKELVLQNEKNIKNGQIVKIEVNDNSVTVWNVVKKDYVRVRVSGSDEIEKLKDEFIGDAEQEVFNWN